MIVKKPQNLANTIFYCTGISIFSHGSEKNRNIINAHAKAPLKKKAKHGCLFYNYSSNPALDLALDEYILGQCIIDRQPRFRFWLPEKTAIILGISNKYLNELHFDRCQSDRIPIFRRFSGGGTVLINSSVINWTYCLPEEKNYPISNITTSYSYFSSIITDFLKNRSANPTALQCNNFDICIGDRKFGGSAQARRKKTVLHHGSIILNSICNEIEKYLKPPLKQPEYRQKREHKDFVTSLAEQNINFKTRAEFCNAFFEYHKKELKLVKNKFSKKEIEQAEKNSNSKYNRKDWNLKL